MSKTIAPNTFDLIRLKALTPNRILYIDTNKIARAVTLGDHLDLTNGVLSVSLTLPDVNSNPVSNSISKITTNNKGLVTNSTPVTSADIDSIYGFTPVSPSQLNQLLALEQTDVLGLSNLISQLQGLLDADTNTPGFQVAQNIINQLASKVSSLTGTSGQIAITGGTANPTLSLTNDVSIPGAFSATKYNFAQSEVSSSLTTCSPLGGTVEIDSWDTSLFNSGEYLISIKRGGTNKIEVTKLIISYDPGFSNATPEIMEIGSNTGTPLHTFDASVSNGLLSLMVTAPSGTYSWVRIHRTLMKTA
jgi:hypothetical protein